MNHFADQNDLFDEILIKKSLFILEEDLSIESMPLTQWFWTKGSADRSTNGADTYPIFLKVRPMHSDEWPTIQKTELQHNFTSI
jgi:hypothetical protein